MKYGEGIVIMRKRTTWFDTVPAHWEVKVAETEATYRVSNVDRIQSDGEKPVSPL